MKSPYDIEIPGDCGYLFEMSDGVIQVSACKRRTDGDSVVSEDAKPVEHPRPNLEEFFEDQNILLALSTHGPMWVLYVQLNKFNLGNRGLKKEKK